MPRVHPTDAVVILALSSYAVRPEATAQEQRACIDHLTDVGHDAAADTLATVLGLSPPSGHSVRV